MGGDGSGRYPRSETKTTVEQCRTLDINDLNREGLLAPGTSGTTAWSRDGTEIGRISHRRTTTADGEVVLRLSYTITPHWDADREIDYRVPLTFTECNFGGTRPWFVCPGAACDERVAKLYRPRAADKYLCRHCHNLGYESSQRSGNPFYENVVKPLQAMDDASAAFRDRPLGRERLRACYEARTALNEGLDQQFDDDELVADLSGPETFEKWCDEVLKSFETRQGFGIYGRCEATAKTTGERCRQSAIGHHKKCYYHGGAPGSGIGEGQRDRAQERIDARDDRSENPWEVDDDRLDYYLAALAPALTGRR